MNINDRLSTNARKHPHATAYIFQDEKKSYFEFEQSVHSFAANLLKMGYQKGDHIALVTWNNPYFLIAFYGALKIGVVVIPINPRYTASELQYIVQHSEVKAIITADVILNSLVEIVDELFYMKHFVYHSSEQGETISNKFPDYKVRSFTSMLDVEDTNVNEVKIDAEDTAVILYTSGTTGRPKGTMLTHKSVYYAAKGYAQMLGVNEKDRMIVTLPVYHVFGMSVALNGPLFYGGTLLIVPQFSPNAIFEIAHKYRATIFAGVPTMFHYLLQNDLEDHYKRKCFSSVRFSLSGGASMPLTLLNDYEHLFQSPILEGYGLTEAAPVTFNLADRNRKIGSIGRCVPYVEAKIVNSAGEEVGKDEKGELMIKGPVVMKGYYKSPEETEAILQNGWLKTQDVAERDEDGYFYIIDRMKDIIIVKGHNVYPREVEEVIYRHADISEVAVVGIPHKDYGEEVCAFIVTNEHTSPNQEEIVQFCKKHLTKYKVPTQVFFLNEIPKNATGKIDKNVLRHSPIG